MDSRAIHTKPLKKNTPAKRSGTGDCLYVCITDVQPGLIWRIQTHSFQTVECIASCAFDTLFLSCLSFISLVQSNSLGGLSWNTFLAWVPPPPFFTAGKNDMY